MFNSSKDENPYALQLCIKIKNLKDSDYKKLEIAEDFNLNIHYVKGWLPIHYAAHLGKENILKLLIDKGASPNLTLKTIDKRNGLQEVWRNGFTLIANETLRQEIRNYYKNSGTTIGLPVPAIIRIAKNFLQDWQTFSSFCRVSEDLSYILSPYLKICKKIGEIQKTIKQNKNSLNYYRGDNPVLDSYQLDATNLEGLRQEIITSLLTKNESLDKEIDFLYEKCSQKMDM